MTPVRLGLAAPHPIPDALLESLLGLLPGARPLPVDPPDPVAVRAAAYAADVDPADAPVLGRRVRDLAATHGVDAALVAGPLAARPPGLVVTDVDSTLIADEVIELIAEHAGTRAEVAAVTERAMRGELDFAESLAARVATLAGVPETVFADVSAQVSLSPGARELVDRVHARGGRVGLVSGGFVEVVGPLARSLGIADDLVAANRLEVRAGRLTGRTLGPVVDRAAKARRLTAYAARAGVPLAETLAVGDGANDLDLLAAAGLGVAYCAKPVTRDAADAAVSFPRLDAALAFVAGG